MPNDMGSFRVDMVLENPARPGAQRTLRSVLVDTAAELSWVPAEVLESLGVERNNKWLFRQADGTILGRWTGSVLVYVAGKRAADEVVFGQPGDLVLLGSRTLEGLNFRVEPVTKQLVDAGPAPAAVVGNPGLAPGVSHAALVRPRSSSDSTKARYTASDHQPRHFSISVKAASRESAGRYGRAVVSASYTSTTPTICAESGISSPRRRSG